MSEKRATATKTLKNVSMLTILLQQILFLVTYFFFREIEIIPILPSSTLRTLFQKPLSREYLERYFDTPVVFENQVEIMKWVLETKKLFVLILIICIIRLLVIIFSSKRKRKQALIGLIITLAVCSAIVLHALYTEELYYLYMRLLSAEVLSFFCLYLLKLQKAGGRQEEDNSTS